MAKKRVNRKQEELNGAEQSGDDSNSTGVLDGSAIAQTAGEDPVFKFLEKYWRPLLVIVLAVLAVSYVKQTFEDTYVTSMRRAADVYLNMQTEYTTFLAAQKEIKGVVQDQKLKQDKVREEGAAPDDPALDAEDAKPSKHEELLERKERSLTKLKEYFKALEVEREPYRSIAKIYDGLVASASGDFTRAKVQLETFKWREFSGSNSTEGFFAELAAITLARVLLDDEKARAEGKALLTELAQQAQHVNVSASLTLARITESPEEQKQVIAILESLSKNNPEQSELLGEQIDKLRS
ncbi:hypothetical protein OAO01_01840 [Oligoflexia bacterium]|nr:hypothetical protein [Oligoflexia bacterium]